MKELVIRINKDFFEKHCDDDKTPIYFLKEMFYGTKGVDITGISEDSILLQHDEQYVDYVSIKRKVTKLLQEKYKGENIKGAVSYLRGDIPQDASGDEMEKYRKEFFDRFVKFISGESDGEEDEEDEGDEYSEYKNNMAKWLRRLKKLEVDNGEDFLFNDDDFFKLDDEDFATLRDKLAECIGKLQDEAGEDDDDEDNAEESEPSHFNFQEYMEKYEKAKAEAEKEERAQIAQEREKLKNVINKINSLVGASEFKQLANEIISIADEINRTKTFDVLSNQCYLFSIGDGYGLSTYLNLIAEILDVKHLCKLSDPPVREARLDPYKGNGESFYSVSRALATGDENEVQILCVDISEWMNHTDTSYFKNFLRDIENCSKEFITIFRIPFVDKDILERIRRSIADVLSVKTVSFPPFSQDEIKKFAEEQLKKYEFTMGKDAWDYFFERISQEKSDGRFYGVNTVIKVVKELIYIMHVSNSKSYLKKYHISANEAKALCGGLSEVNLSGEEMLDRMVGVENIKKRIEEVVAQIEFAIRDGVQRPCIHMRFVGNPGTGKTTVARIIGKMLKERGVLRVGAFFEYAGRDFCGRFIGETAPKTSSICRDAYGSVLFIDEAYTLYRGDDNTKDYGREAIDTLIAEMENHRSDLVVIMAGYADDMDTLMKGNHGLASRMPYTIEFPNFTREQLVDVFISMVKGKFDYDDGLFDAAREFFANLPDETLSSKDFSNARYVRNLFERTWAKAAMRCQLEGNTQIILTADDFRLASADKEFASKITKKMKIGF